MRALLLAQDRRIRSIGAGFATRGLATSRSVNFDAAITALPTQPVDIIVIAIEGQAPWSTCAT